ncbi:3-isopropylmalate dehydratase small subunit [Parvularcula marina]|uniref:3-isopropylmalate dehydratase small subunit n=1 Tax=Parvularcula marina TaxID=2292771 RepID=UPI003514B808
MKPFTTHRGIAAPLVRDNIDTDQIIPSREMKTVGKTGLSEGLFAGWRYLTPDARDLNPDFILNKPAFENASILIAGANFGCGSSREHAVWALAEYGIRAVIAESFGSIFRANAIRNGVLPVTLPRASIKRLATDIQDSAQPPQIEIDLNKCVLLMNGESEAVIMSFQLADAEREMLLNGYDPVDLTQKHSAKIEDFIRDHRIKRPWIYKDKI